MNGVRRKSIVFSVIITGMAILGCGGGGGGGGGVDVGNTNDQIEIQNVTASSVSSDKKDCDAAKTVDGVLDTMWISEATDTSAKKKQYLVYDFGESKKFEQVIIFWEFDFATEYKLQVSSDNSTWEDIYSVETGNGRVDNIILPSAATGRYLRLYMTNNCFGTSYALYEIRVYGKSGMTPPSGPNDGNLVWNGDFSNGGWNWQRWSEVSSGGDAAFSVSDGVMNITIVNGGTNMWSVQLGQGPIPVVKNKQYVLTYDAWADEEREYNLFLQEGPFDVNGDGGIWSNYDTSLTLKLGTKRKTYTYKFIMCEKSDNNAYVAFNFGQSKVGVHIANISVVEENITLPAVGTELVTNGDIGNGLTGWNTWTGSGASGNIGSDSGALKTTVTKGGADVYSFHLNHYAPGIKFQSGHKYRWGFEVWSDSDSRSFYTMFSRYGHQISTIGGNWDNYSDFNEIANIQKTRFVRYLVPKETNYLANLYFNFGGDDGAVFNIDNVTAKEVSSFPWESWSGPAVLDGGANIGSAVIASLSRLYTSSSAVGGVFYKVSVSIGTTYEVICMATSVGSPAVLSVIRKDGSTYYNGAANSLDNLLSTEYRAIAFTALDDEVYVIVTGDNSYSFGLAPIL